MTAVKNFKIIALTLIIVVIAEFIGIRKIGIIVLMPILYATILGGIISWPKLKLLSMKDMDDASFIFPIALMILIAKVGLSVGPQLETIMAAKGTMLVTMVAHILGTIILGLPVAMLVGLKRESVGATYSLGREAQVAIIANKYGINSPEGLGVMGVFIVGTVLGAMWTSVLTSLVVAPDFFHPLSLALGAGTSSMSMSTAAVEVINTKYASMGLGEQIMAYMNTENLLVNVIGLYANMFITLPLTSWLYDVIKGRREERRLAASFGKEA